ncbi:MAG: DNA topoisomerase 1 [Flavobacteriales bacterium]|nr:DNA topoisomerase 1 [Flavobacteriales bacterium]|tara:strand:- start:20286 stop:22565 length:2280 start_codon:yes stop_codon:yes gene_type:complete
MSYTLLIVESPAKCKKIEGYLGKNYKCMASYGHITQLSGLDSIDIENNFKPKFDIMDEKKQQISKLKTAIKNANEVILASDDDREGEAIAWHICKVFKLPVNTTKRIIFNEITKKAIQKAVENPKTINMDTVYAQQSRQILDILIGFKISPILWKKISVKSGLSAGRCQTPALRLIYENQKEIDNSPGTKVYSTIGYFTSKNIPFSLNKDHNDEKEVEEFLEKTVNYEHIYDAKNPKESFKKAPTPFTTSTLQQSSSNELKLSPKVTMKACQVLYEGGFITYMRTDSTTYSEDFIQKITTYIEKTYTDKYVRGDINKLSLRNEKDTNAQEAHEAIRPTNIDLETVSQDLGNNEVRVYKLIRRNTLESCMPPAKYSVIKASVSAPDDLFYDYNAEQVIFPGWQIVNGYEKECDVYAYFKTLKKKSIVQYKKITSKVTIKNLKTHYTESRLVNLLEKNGIGRPSTFSSLVDKIQERNYVKKTNVKGKKINCIDFELVDDEIIENENEREFGNENNKLVIEPLGILVIEILLDHFNDLFEYEYTKNMEDKLDDIAKGNKIWHTLCKECLQQINELSDGLLETKEEIKIDEKHSYIIGQYGPVIKCVDNNNVSFKKIKDSIDFDKLRNGMYKIDDIIDNNVKQRIIGYIDKNPVFLKNGKYGLYFNYNDKNIGIGDTEKEFNEITIEDYNKIIKSKETNSNIIRVIDSETSIRNGKYGDYVYYKTSKMKKPKFIKLNDFIKEHGVNSYKTCNIDVLKKWLSKK